MAKKIKKSELSLAVETALVEPEAPAVVKKLRARRPYVPSSDDPVVELRRLTKRHRALTKDAVTVANFSRDKTMKDTGEKIISGLNAEDKKECEILIKSFEKKASSLQTDMKRELRKVPFYTTWLGEVFGVGPIVAAYLVTSIDIRKAEKPSNLRRYCGFAVVDGALERRSGAPKAIGGTGTYNSTIRMRIFQMFSTLWKKKACAPNNKYARIWRQSVERIQHSERVFDRGVDKNGEWTGKIISRGKPVSARGFAFKYGFHKAVDVFLEDLYIVWRAMEGLPVWPSYYASKLGYEHGGKICVNAPKMLTVDEAIALVGNDVFRGGGVEDTDDEILEELDQAAE